MAYDIIFITGEPFFDHPMCGVAILKRLLETKGYTVKIIETPKNAKDITIFGKPGLFFGITSGSVDSMVSNYTPLKKPRNTDDNTRSNSSLPDRAVIVYSNWIKQYYKDTCIVLGGVEASLRRFTHYDYWDNKLRKPILFDSRADILVYGNGEKQTTEIASRLKQKKHLKNIPGTCIISTEPDNFTLLPSYSEVSEKPENFCRMQKMFSNNKNLAQKIDNRYVLQYTAPKYTSSDLDSYYELPFTRKITSKELKGFEFSVITHRGCIGNCNFCAINLMQGDKIVSRSQDSILREMKYLTKLAHFKGIIDNLGGPSANMYGMDCHKCQGECIKCSKLNKSNRTYIDLLKRARNVKGIKKIYIRGGVRYDLASPEFIKELAKHHTPGKLRIAPEHVNSYVLRLMNKPLAGFENFVKEFRKSNKHSSVSFYFMTAHPGSSMKEAKELSQKLKKLDNTEDVQVFTPTPMTVSTCMYYTSLNPKTLEKVYVPYTYREKKEQKRVVFN